MKENVLEVLMYLFENYMDEETEFDADQEILTAKLSQAGFHRGEISKAFTWLEDLSAMCEGDDRGFSGGTRQSLRHYAPDELKKLDAPTRGLLLRLEQYGILDTPTREMVVDRIMALETEDIDLEQVKWVVMMVLYNRPDREESYAWLEELVFEDDLRDAVH
jgi:Smg protein